MQIEVKLTQLEMLENWLEKNNLKQDIFFSVNKKYGKSYGNGYMSDDSYMISASLEEVSDDDEIVDVKFGNAKELNALAKKMHEQSYSEKFRLSNKSKRKLSTLNTAKYISINLSSSEDKLKDLFLVAIDNLDTIINTGDFENKDLINNSLFLFQNKDNYPEIKEINVTHYNTGKVNVGKEGFQYLYQSLKKELNEKGISFLSFLYQTKIDYWFNFNLSKNLDTYIQNFHSNLFVNNNLQSALLNNDNTASFKEFKEFFFKELFIEHLNVTINYIEKTNVTDSWKKEQCSLLNVIEENFGIEFFQSLHGTKEIKKIEILENYFEKHFENDLNFISFKDFLKRNKFSEQNSLDVSSIFNNSSSKHNESLLISTEKYIEMIPFGFLKLNSKKNYYGNSILPKNIHDIFEKNNNEKDVVIDFYQKSMNIFKDVIELATNVEVDDISISNKNIVLSLKSNEEIDKDILMKLFDKTISTILKYNNLKDYEQYHENEISSLTMKFDNELKNQINTTKRKSINKF